jgi:lipid-A-disaccharide synthase
MLRGVMQIFFSVGEPSGDLHGANLIRQLQRRTELTARGLGGPKMQAAGCELLRDMSDLAVMGLFPVLAKLPQFLALRSQVARALDERPPDAVVLIDYPGFNWHVAGLAKERGIPVFYYGLPQLWAWASWRVSKVQRYVDHALCKLPFEEAWFQSQGCRATYVGHPYFDELNERRLDKSFVAAVRPLSDRLVTILPGSRTQEVRNNLPVLLKAAARVRREVRGVRLAVASYNERQADLARRLVAAGPAPADVFVSRTPELISAADCCLACSGSVSLELLYHAKPAVIVYRVGWLTYKIVHRLVNIRCISLVNMLASQEPFAAVAPAGEEVLYPEYPTWRDCSEEVAGNAIGWLRDEGRRQRLISRLMELRERVAGAGASATAADYILKQLDGSGAATTRLPVPLRKAS